MSSGRMPSRIHHTDRVESRPSAVVAKGTPLSVRMMRGRPLLPEEPQEDGPGRLVGRGMQPLAAEEVAAEPVDDGERVAVHPILGAELAFEVSRPDRVRLLHRRARGAGMHAAGTAASWPDAAVSLELLLKALGHEVRAAFDGSQALRMEAEFHPDVVLLDIGMPGLDGYQVARRLRALRHEQRDEQPLRIIAVTGWGQDSDRAKSRAAGFDGHLVKPAQLADLERLLGDLTAHRI